ncbi:MAG: type I restriction enzyme HsdR N-terminal domain-containing protein [Bacteroidetes bacterium]|nr:type I restriction enzyme HsdR N-terminal domain-containing protein [Bacteroidota bacterium]
MQALNLPDHGVKTKHAPEGDRIFDPVRRSWVALTPEEWVRQHVLNFLVNDLGCPPSLIAVEKQMELNRLVKRTDIVVHGTDGMPLLLVECKAPHVKLDQAVFEQAARYNTVFKVPLLLVTNGMLHYCCKVAHGDGRIEFLPSLPAYPEMARVLSL